MQIQGTIKNVTEYGLGDGAIYISVTDGAPPYTYFWSNKDTCQNPDNLKAGIYSVLVQDEQMYSVSDTFEVIQPPPDTIRVTFKIEHPSKTGAADGKITTTITGGYSPFIVYWSNGKDTKDIDELVAGKYIITINDSRGQMLTDTVSLNDKLFDIDGNIYNTIKIGDQTWMSENLKVTHNPDNIEITSYLYNNDTTYEKIHGRLYTWNVAMNGFKEEKIQGICPDGWHLPSDEEFKVLEKFLGMTESEANISNGWRGAGIGTKLKYGGSSGFNARLSGRRAPSGTFSVLGRVEYHWTSTESGNNAWRRCLDLYANDVGRWDSFSKEYAFSVRCVKND